MSRQLDLYDYRNGYIVYNPFINYSQIDIYEFIQYIFERDSVPRPTPAEVHGLLVQVGFDVTAFTPPAYQRGSLPRPCDVSSRRRLRA